MTFPYFNHGIGGLNDSLDFYVWFEDDPSRARRKLTSALNWPKGLTLVGAKDWCGHHVHAYEAYGKYNGFGAHVLGSDYAPSKAPKEFKAGWAGLDEDMRRLVGFEAALDDQLHAIHDQHSIAFVFRCRERATRTSRHDASVPAMDDALDTVRAHLSESTKGVAPLATTLRLYEEMLALRCGKYGGKAMPKKKRQVHLEALLERLVPSEPWDTLKVAFKLKAAPPADVISSLTKHARKTVWKSAVNYQGDGSGAYSAAVFKLPKAAYEALEKELG